MTPAIFRQHKSIQDGNINIISNGGGLIPIIQTASYGRPKSHINCLRVSLFKAFPYEVVRIIIMDNDSVWSLFCELWNEIRDDLEIHCLYVPKDNDKDAAMAEVACKILESMVKKI